MAKWRLKEKSTRPLQNGTFCLIFASGSNFNPRNILYIPVVDPPEADRFPQLKVRDLRLELEQKLPFFKGLST
ncbi:MAG: hypothetical protein JRD05_03300 [Deltaproteobacteria bacterium]|nr:hypothetical protein [Deltaproteobacteria bacterium]